MLLKTDRIIPALCTRCFASALLFFSCLGLSQAQLHTWSEIQHEAERGNVDSVLAWSVAIQADHLNKREVREFYDARGKTSRAFALAGKEKMAIDYIDKALNDCADYPGKETAIYALLLKSKSETLDLLGHYDDVFEILDEAERILLALNADKEILMQVYRQYGKMTYASGDYYTSVRYFGKRLDLANELYTDTIKDGKWWGRAHYNLGSSYWGTEDRDSCKAHYLEAVKIWEQCMPADYPYFGYIYDVLGSYAWEDGDREGALEYFSKAGKLRLSEQRVEDEADKLQVEARRMEQAGSYEEALAGYQAALDYRKSVLGENNPSTIGCYSNIARLLINMDNPEEALSTCQQAIALYIPEFNPTDTDELPQSIEHASSLPYLLDILIVKFEILSTLGREKTSATINTMLLILDVVDQLRIGHKAEHSKIFWTQKILPFTEKALDYCLNNVPTDDRNNDLPYILMEKSKAFVLHEATKGMEAMDIAGISSELREQERDIREKLTETERFIYLEEKRCDLADEGKLETWNMALDRYTSEYKHLITRIETEYPDYFQLKYEVNIPALSTVREGLTASQCMLSYFVGSEHVFVLLISKEQVKLYGLGSAQEINALTSKFRSKVTDISPALQSPEAAYQAFNHISSSLYTRLFPDELSRFLTPELVILADGPLHYIPFGALLTNNKRPESRDYSGLPFLALEKQLVEIPSASLWMHSLSHSSHKLSYAGFAPEYGHTKSPTGYVPLRYNRDEVIHAKNKFRGEIFLGEDCLESTFKSRASRAGVLHLAMHTTLDDAQPMYSGFIFNHREDSINDGVLTIGEIYNLKLQAQLVVLSSCNTGSGELIGGEGVMSLARAFSFAGCPSIVMSLWECEDQSTNKMVSSFMDHLKNGEQKSLALQNAQRDYLAQAVGIEGHPYYWSGLMVVGNDAPLINEISLWWSVAAAVVLLLGGIRFMRHRQRSSKS